MKICEKVKKEERGDVRHFSATFYYSNKKIITKVFILEAYNNAQNDHNKKHDFVKNNFVIKKTTIFSTIFQILMNTVCN